MPSSGDNLSLGALGKAVGANGSISGETALAADGRGSGATTSLSDFYIATVATAISGQDEPSENSSEAYSISFTSAGSLFNTRIRDRADNFTWAAVLASGFFNINNGAGGDKDYRVSVGYTGVSSDTTVRFSVTFNDSFNDHATRYNTAIIFTAEIQNTGGGLGDDTCFIEGTQVLLADGTYKNIEWMEIGESVKGNNGNNTVLALDPTLLGNRLLYGFNGGTPFVTAEHPFMTTEGWKSINPQATIDENVEGFKTLSDIGQLQVNDIISGSSTNFTINSIVSASAATSSYLWNFNVDGDNTYYADNYLVHNKCFVGDTLVTMADGTYKTIENIEVNDLVFTQNGNEKVNEVVSPIHNNIIELSFSNGNSTKNTDDHPYYVIDKGWCSMKPQLSTELYDVKCEQLEVGDIFIDDEDTQIELLNIEKVNGEFKTYTFSTDSKTYYANKLLVHSEI